MRTWALLALVLAVAPARAQTEGAPTTRRRASTR
jgi:hypothetical protein